MVIFGVHVSDEAIAAVIFGIGGLLTAFGIWIRANAKKIEANAKKIEANALTIAADAKKTTNSAEAELAERLSVTNTLKQYSDMLQQQIIINQQLKERGDQEAATYQKRLDEKEAQDESNYKLLSNTQDRIGQEIHGVLRQRFDAVDAKLDALPSKLQDDNKQWVQTLVGELVTQLAERFAELTMAQEWYPFPDVNDPEWREDFVKPLANKVRLYRRPVSSDASLTDAVIPATGETMEIIQGRKKGWLVVRRISGVKAQYGWLPEHEVLTGVPAAKRATSEVTVTVSSSTVPVT